MADRVPTIPTGKVARRIAALLRAEPRRLWTPKEISRSLRIPAATVRKELVRLCMRGEPPVITNPHRGFYRAFLDPGLWAHVEVPELVLHAIQLGCTLPPNRGWGPPGAGPVSWGGLGSRPVWTRDESNGQYFRSLAWVGRGVTVVVSPASGGVQVSLRASDAPVLPADLVSFAGWLEGVMLGSNLLWVDPEVQNVEMNLDYRRLWFADAKRVGLRVFQNAWVQAYQKAAELMRVETRFHKVEDNSVTLREMVAALEGLQGRGGGGVPYLPPPDSDGMEVA